MVRVDEGGAAIEVEVWSLDPAAFGDFVSKIPGPLGIGKILLESGEELPGFIAEPRAMIHAEEITRFGGWRAFLRGK
jgi:allophanate hydrolase